jgi:hypothetical protein
MTHHPYAVGHTYMPPDSLVNLGLPAALIPAGDEVAVVLCRDAVTGEACSHFGKADDFRAFLLISMAFGLPGRQTEEGGWVGDELHGFELCANGHPVDWLRRLTNVA